LQKKGVLKKRLQIILAGETRIDFAHGCLPQNGMNAIPALQFDCATGMFTDIQIMLE
jgi:hypothetical protein